MGRGHPSGPTPPRFTQLPPVPIEAELLTGDNSGQMPPDHLHPLAQGLLCEGQVPVTFQVHPKSAASVGEGKWRAAAAEGHCPGPRRAWPSLSLCFCMGRPPVASRSTLVIQCQHRKITQRLELKRKQQQSRSHSHTFKRDATSPLTSVTATSLAPRAACLAVAHQVADELLVFPTGVIE